MAQGNRRSAAGGGSSELVSRKAPGFRASCARKPVRSATYFFAIKILSFQNFYEALKTCSAGRKDFFDTLENILCRIDVAVVERPAFRALPEPNLRSLASLLR